MVSGFFRSLLKWVGIAVVFAIFQAAIFSAMHLPGAKIEAGFWVYLFSLGQHTLFPVGTHIVGNHGIKVH